MAFWWVNQNQTAEHEITGGYLWSPKRTSDGRRNHFYDNMREVQVGDVVFSYYGSRIQHVGIVSHTAVSSPKPADFGATGEYWNADGWMVSVTWHDVPEPFRPSDMIDELRPHLPEKYYPIRPDNGYGLQNVYLAGVPDGMAAILMRRLRGFAARVLQLVGEQVEDDAQIQRVEDGIERLIKNNKTIDTTVKEALIKARKGQGRFRQNLESIESRCRITGVLDRRLLRASHIKPWRACETNEERLDGYNGLLLTPTMDHLFDRGLISFSDDGSILFSPRISVEELVRLGIDPSAALNVGRFTPEQRVYLAYHRTNIFH